MRISVVIIALMIGMPCLKAQSLKESQVPSEVKEAFRKQFPNVTDVEWEKEGEDYEVEYEVKRVNMDNGKAVKGTVEKSILFNAGGAILQTEEEIPVSGLPKAVSEYVAKNLHSKKIKEAAKITGADGTVSYEAEVAKVDYLFDANGNFLKKEVENEADDDGEKKEN
jgi:hypothetical protein